MNHRSSNQGVMTADHQIRWPTSNWSAKKPRGFIRSSSSSPGDRTLGVCSDSLNSSLAVVVTTTEEYGVCRRWGRWFDSGRRLDCDASFLPNAFARSRARFCRHKCVNTFFGEVFRDNSAPYTTSWDLGWVASQVDSVENEPVFYQRCLQGELSLLERHMRELLLLSLPLCRLA